MNKLLTYSLFLALPLCGQNITRFAGIYNALDYAYGVPGSSPGGLKVSVGNFATGAQTITLDFGYTTLSDGTKIYPFSTNAPITVGSERVTPSSITCLSPNVYSTCQIRATFSQLHGPGDNVASGTYGLQEAINAAATLGGAIVVDGKWTVAGGTQGMIDAATVPANTAINDNRQGQVFGNGSGGSGTVTSVTAGPPLTGGTITHSGTIGCQVASGSQAGCLSAADYAAFTGKQNAGNYITALTGDGAASGPGSAALTLATVNGNVGACGDATHTSQITLDAKGRATGCTPVLITASSGITALTGDVTATGPGSAAATLATVGSAGSCGDSTHSCQLTFDTKGRETARANVSITGSSGLVYTGILSGIPTCDVSHVGLAFITDQPAGQQIYACSNISGSYAWGQNILLGPSGALLVSSGALDIDTNVVCRLTNSCPIAALWSFAIGQDFTEQASGSTPAAGKLHIYANTDHTFHQVTSGGVDTSLSGGSVTPHWVAATNSGTQAIPGSLTQTDMLWNTNDASTTNPSLHDPVSNTQNFVADATGFWHGVCEVSTGTVTTDIGVLISVNGTPIWNGGGPGIVSTGSGVWQINVPWSAHLTSGDIVKCVALSNVGFASTAGAGTKFYMELQH